MSYLYSGAVSYGTVLGKGNPIQIDPLYTTGVHDLSQFFFYLRESNLISETNFKAGRITFSALVNEKNIVVCFLLRFYVICQANSISPYYLGCRRQCVLNYLLDMHVYI